MPASVLKISDALLPRRLRPTIETVGQFVRNSALIADSRLATSEDWNDPEIKNHLEIAKILFLEGHSYVAVELVNSTLVGQPNRYFRRGGNEGLDDDAPKGKIVPRLARLLDRRIMRRIKELEHATDQEKSDFGWWVHHHVRMYRLFGNGNSRTARLQMNHVRLLLGLDVLIIKVEEAREYKDRYRRFLEQRRLAKSARLKVVA
jgi:hypothetical protein